MLNLSKYTRPIGIDAYEDVMESMATDEGGYKKLYGKFISDYEKVAKLLDDAKPNFTNKED